MKLIFVNLKKEMVVEAVKLDIKSAARGMTRSALGFRLRILAFLEDFGDIVIGSLKPCSKSSE